MNTEETGNTMTHFAPTKTRRSGFILVFFMSLTSGCGEFAYKRGANSSDLEIAKKACGAKESDATAFEKCMADSGWTLKNMNKMSPLDDDPVIEASTIPSDRRIENAATTTPGQQNAEDYVPASPGAVQPTTKVKRNPDRMDMFKVSSWWKAGGGAENLKVDTEGCVTKLGEPHRPDNLTQYASRGLLLCMKEKGWSGLRAK